jgi:chromate reductase, NAD(P)H dehydrogenase (quinone)
MNILLVSGSLRAASSNARALDALKLIAPPEWIVRTRAPLDQLPFFNPDVEKSGLPDAARQWRDEIAWADAVIISSPEYAHGVPGVLKNALDWLVGGIEISGKPVALLNATPPADYAQASLRETLTVMGARIIDEASIDLPLRGRATDARAIAGDPQLSEMLRGALTELAAAARASSRSAPAWDGR